MEQAVINLVDAMKQQLSYNHTNKKLFHSRARRVLKGIAQMLGLAEGTYDLRSNKGGIAVSGEVTLHSEYLYIQISKSCMGPGHEIMYRSCCGRKDYCGGHNHYFNVNRLVNNLSGVITSFKTVMEGDA